MGFFAHAQTVDTRPLFPPPTWPGYEANDEDGPLQISLLDHILKAHWKELHLGSEMDTERLMDMLSSSQLEVLSKFKDIFKPYL